MHSKKTGLIKIGKSIQPEVRLLALERLFEDELSILATVNSEVITESELHNRFSHQKAIHPAGGTEWFRKSDELLECIEECEGRPDLTEHGDIKYREFTTFGLNLHAEHDRELIDALHSIRDEIGARSWSAVLRHIVMVYLNPPEVPPVALSPQAPAIDYRQLAAAITEGLVNAGVQGMATDTQDTQPLPIAESREDPNDPLIGRLLGNSWDEM
jgi:hypothetical protein